MRLSASLLGVLVAFAGVSGVAVAQQPSSSSPLITASGYGSAKPNPVDRRSKRSIAAAVERAEKAALPLAVKEARERAALIAQASGLTLGNLMSVGDAPASPYGPFAPYGGGTFGPGKFCGTIRPVRVTLGEDGKVQRKRLKPRRVCRIPPRVQTTVSVTFATVAPAPAG